jgi:hypothetical protein
MAYNLWLKIYKSYEKFITIVKKYQFVTKKQLQSTLQLRNPWVA